MINFAGLGACISVVGLFSKINLVNGVESSYWFSIFLFGIVLITLDIFFVKKEIDIAISITKKRGKKA